MTKKTLGIVGGGQLGMFICIAAEKLGLQTIVFSQESNFSAKFFCDNYLIGDFKKKQNLDKFIENADFFTVETENIPKSFLRTIQKKKKTLSIKRNNWDYSKSINWKKFFKFS